MKDDRSISLNAALDAVDLECEEFRGIFGRIEKRIKALPSAQPVVISKSENTTECEDAVSRFEADASALGGIGDAIMKIQTSFPDYFTEDKLRELTGI